MNDRPAAGQTLPPIRVRTYIGQTQAEAARQFEADAALAEGAGYVPVSQAWEGTTLTVTYQLQASLGRHPAPAPAAQTRLDPSAILVVVAGAMMVVGSFLPWITASSVFASVSRGGMEGGDGWLIAAAGAMAIVGGLEELVREGGGWLGGLLGSLVGGFVGWLDFAEVQGRIREVSDTLIVAETGIGLWLILAGAAMGALASVASWITGRGDAKKRPSGGTAR